jgi:type II secretory pathway pseudopilin PulG
MIKKNTEGITLIVLVITIVVLMILASVTVSTLTGDNGLISFSKETKTEKIEEQVKKSIQTELLEKKLGNSNGEISNEEIVAILEKYGTINYDSDGNIESLQVTETDTEIPFDELYNQNVKAVVDGVTIPDGFYYVGGSKNTGLVISDNIADKEKYKGKSNVGTDLEGNQFVWIEVPKTTTVYQTAGLNISGFSETDLNSIKTDLINYAKEYRTDGYSDEWYDGCGVSQSDYSTMYNKMLKSVYQSGGFWIGRYELGDDNATSTNTGRTSSTGTGNTPVINANKIPYNYITCSQAESLAETFASSGYTSSLMFGVQWDLMMKYLETKGTSQADLKTNSTSLGNYINANFTVTNTLAKYSTDYGASWTAVPEAGYTKTENSSVLLTTGAGARNNKMNIYDLAGNVCEWTLEYTSNSSYPCAGCGGYCDNSGSSFPAIYRNGYRTTFSDPIIGVRVSLY